jgi:general secretion pathway protein G
MSEKYKDRRSEKGFSLIELIVVLVILGLLAAIVAPRVMDKLGKARGQTAKLQIEEFDGAMDAFVFDVGRYPTTAEGLDALVTNTTGNDSWAGPYLKKGLPIDPWGRRYEYIYPGQHGTDYEIYSYGPDGQAGTGDDIVSWK